MSRTIPSIIAVLLLAGCATPPEGRWMPIDAPRVFLERVTLSAAPADEDTAAVCREARETAARELRRQLPGRLEPVDFATEGRRPGDAVLVVTLPRCELSRRQWDVGGGEPSFTYITTIDVAVSLSTPSGTLLDYRTTVHEQVHTGMPSPRVEFMHVAVWRRVLELFAGGRVLIPAAQSTSGGS